MRERGEDAPPPTISSIIARRARQGGVVENLNGNGDNGDDRRARMGIPGAQTDSYQTGISRKEKLQQRHTPKSITLDESVETMTARALLQKARICR